MILARTTGQYIHLHPCATPDSENAPSSILLIALFTELFDVESRAGELCADDESLVRTRGEGTEKD